MIFLGVDVGTQGVRAVAADENGNVRAAASRQFREINIASESRYKEQCPADWWDAAVLVLREITSAVDPKLIIAVAVDATSGTVLLADKNGEALTNGIMYNDPRAVSEADELNERHSDFARDMGYRFNFSYALPKLVWLERHEREKFNSCAYILHQADYISGRLTGEFGKSDFSNALKTACDIKTGDWPEFIKTSEMYAKLPSIHAPGSRIGAISAIAAQATGLCEGTAVCAGASDGYASALSAGAVSPGEWAPIIGTTFVIKGVTRNMIRDEAGRVYCHRHPDGYFMPGGASNVGGSCLNEMFGQQNFVALDAECEDHLPTGALIYPLSGQGERFPFVNAKATGFIIGAPKENAALFGAYMEGVAYTERLSYELLEELGCEVGDTVFAVGGAAKSDVWLKIRASVLNKTLKVPAETGAAIGSAMLCASGFLGGIENAAARMVRISKTVLPDAALTDRYGSIYSAFKKEAVERIGV